MPARSGLPARLRELRRRRPRRAAFVGVFSVTLIAFLAIGTVLPVLPRYVKDELGSGDVAVGVVMGAFAFTAIVVRPVAGRMADTRTRRTVVLCGLVATAIGGALCLVPAGVPGLIVARLVLGAGDGAVFTAGVSWIVDLAPEERRGQVIGLFGIAVWGGISFGPLVGELAMEVGSYELAFAISAALPLLAALLARKVPDHHRPVPRAKERGPLVPPGVLAPGLALAMANAGYGTMSGFVILHLADRGVGGGAVVFTVFAVAVVFARLALAPLPDRVGAHVTALGGGIAEGVGLAVLAVAPSLPVALLAALVMGAGFSLLFPSLALVALAGAGEERRATAMGTFTAFFDLGFGLGAPIAGAIAALAGYETAFLVAAAASGIGITLGVLLSRADEEHGEVGATSPG